MDKELSTQEKLEYILIHLCGFKVGGLGMTHYWVDPDGKPCDIPLPDLNFIDKWVFPRIDDPLCEFLSPKAWVSSKWWFSFKIPDGGKDCSCKKCRKEYTGEADTLPSAIIEAVYKLVKEMLDG